MKRSRSPGLGEAEAVRLLARRLGTPHAAVRLGIGDDAAVLGRERGQLVWTVDSCLEGAHFERRLLGLADIGWKALHAAASDLAAMGAKPRAALVALELPRGFSRAELDALAAGQARAARALDCPVVGGNLARGARLGLTTSVLGVAARPIARHGARPGDELWLMGEVGLAAVGFALARSGRRPTTGAVRRALDAWRRPQARIGDGLRLVGRAHAAIDVSDGLGGDAGHLAEASGVRVLVEQPALELALPAELAVLAPIVGRSTLDLALAGGEDYALVAAGPRARRPRGARRIGRITQGRGAFLERPGGRLERLGPGYDHLS